MHLGIADHLGWAVAVVASSDGAVVDRRRIELIDPGLPAAPVHHEGGPHLMHRTGEPLGDEALAALVGKVRASITRYSAIALDDLEAAAGLLIRSISLRSWPTDFPKDIATQRRVPYEARVDAIMYREILADLGRVRGWRVHLYDARAVEGEAARVLGASSTDFLAYPRAFLGAPWAKDHRVALAATIVANADTA